MEVLEGAASGLLANLASELISSLRKKHHGIRQKERLEELLVIIHSVIEAAEVRAIRNKSLHNWLKNLEEAAEQGDKALLMANRAKFKSEKNRRNIPPESPLYVGWDRVLTCLSVAQTFAKKLFLSEDDTTEILTTALSKVESACRNAKLFLKLLKLESKSKSYPGIVVNSARVIRRHKSGSKNTR